MFFHVRWREYGLQQTCFYNKWIRNGIATNNYISIGFSLIYYELAPDILDYFYKNKGDKISIDVETGVGGMEVNVYGTEIDFNGWANAAKKDFALKSYLNLTREYLGKLDIRVIRPNFQLSKNDFYLYTEQLSGVVDALGPAYWPEFGEFENPQFLQTEFVITNDVVVLWDDWMHKIQPKYGEHENPDPVIWYSDTNSLPQFHSCWFQYCHGWYEDWLDIQYLDSDNNQKLRLVPPIIFQDFFRRSKE